MFVGLRRRADTSTWAGVQLLSCQPDFLVGGVNPELALCAWTVSPGQDVLHAPGFTTIGK